MDRIPADTISDSRLPTREALLLQALRLFGDKGFDGASVRDIADAAGTNVASVAYHFGSKSGLYRACGVAIAEILGAAIGASSAPSAPQADADPVDLLIAALRRMAGFLFLSDKSALVVPFLLREISAPGEAFDEIYARLMEPFHRRLCQAWSVAAGGDPDGEPVKIAVFSILGQLLYFRVASKAIARRLGKPVLAEQEVAMICDTIETNIRARIAHDRSLTP